jgi:hypothetical protein
MTVLLASSPAVSAPSPSTLPSPFARVAPRADLPGKRTHVQAFWRRVGWIVAINVPVSLLYSPLPWHDPRAYAISLAYSLVYCLGLWLANGYTVDWLNSKVGWDAQPLRRLLFTVAASTLASLLVIVGVGEGFSILLWHRTPGYTFQHNFLAQSAFPLLMTVVISLFLSHGLARSYRARRAP